MRTAVTPGLPSFLSPSHSADTPRAWSNDERSVRQGYGTGNPDNRTRGTIIWSLSNLVYYGMALRWGVELLAGAK